MIRLIAQRHSAGIALLLIGALLAASPSPVLAAEPGELESRIDAHLSAGEFVAALDLTKQIKHAPARDPLLKRIAAAQNDAGARQAADRTLSTIASDKVRTEALDHILAQRFGAPPNVLGQAIGQGFGAQQGIGVGGGGGAGGATTADFDAIIELVTKTIEPDSWDEVGGPGSIAEFEGGVVVDPAGVMRRVKWEDSGEQLRKVRAHARRSAGNSEVRRASQLRKVSLPRLEKAVQLRQAAGRGPSEQMKVLAGITKIKYIMVYPETGDLVIAGRAGDWKKDAEGRIVNTDSGRPVLRLDDLVVIMRQMATSPDARFGCSITPTKEALARTKAFVSESSKTPLKSHRGAREAWLEKIRQAMGRQNIDVYGVDPGSRVAQVIVEADYRMKLVGMGLERGTDGVKSYLDSIQLKKGQAPPSLDVLRWWFTLDYDAIGTTDERNVFEIRGQGVQVLSENEMLTKLGERVHTGKSDDLNRLFAGSFTRAFPALAAKYPVYADLHNVFDLALVTALLHSHDLPEQVGWQMSHFSDAARYPVETGPAPKQVESVINHRVINKTQIIAGVSGGVRVDPGRYAKPSAVKATNSGEMISAFRASPPPKVESQAWWWD